MLRGRVGDGGALGKYTIPSSKFKIAFLMHYPGLIAAFTRLGPDAGYALCCGQLDRQIDRDTAAPSYSPSYLHNWYTTTELRN